MTPKILLVADDQPIYTALNQAIKDWGFFPSKASTLEYALELFDEICPEVTILDIGLLDSVGLEILVEIIKRKSDAKILAIVDSLVDDEVHIALRLGAYDFVTKPPSLEKIRNAIFSIVKSQDTPREVLTSTEKPTNASYFDKIIGKSGAIKETVWLARKVADCDISNVLLQGESGTGKDLFAKAIHYSSKRAEKPFVAINCSAIPSNLIESELFGYEKGAFTDAKSQKNGLFEQASEGTLFLDEIGELELGLQAKLLRILEERTFRRVGGLHDLPLNIRVIAASNRDLKNESAEHRFRSDLYFRLSVMEIELPPLRERGNDVVLLAEYFLAALEKEKNGKLKRTFHPDVLDAFRRFRWEGNIRELRNVIERAMILEDEALITMKFIPEEFYVNGNSHLNEFENRLDLSRHFSLPPDGISLDAVEDWLIQEALRRNDGNVTHAGKFLRVTRDRIRYSLKKKKH
jgi:two-component system, NtrC family, response regulator AtoC